MSKRKYRGGNGQTSQGLRDLNSIRSAKPAGIRLSELPSAQWCKHENAQRKDGNGAGFCSDCGAKWDFRGRLDLGIE